MIIIVMIIIIIIILLLLLVAPGAVDANVDLRNRKVRIIACDVLPGATGLAKDGVAVVVGGAAKAADFLFEAAVLGWGIGVREGVGTGTGGLN
jgi:hypothetical protein